MMEATSGETTSHYPFQLLAFERLRSEEALQRSQGKPGKQSFQKCVQGR